MPSVGPNEAQVLGQLTMSFQGSASGLAWRQVSQTLSGTGRLQVKDAVIVNLNILREVFGRLSILPGLMERLQARLPASYQAKLSARDTNFQPIDLALTAAGGQVQCRELRLTAGTFELAGAGAVGLDGGLTSQLMLRMDPELSAAILRSVKELQSLTGADGRMALPVVLQGTLPRVAVIPDVQYVASRVVTTKAEEFVGNLLQKILEKQGLPATHPKESPVP